MVTPHEPHTIAVMFQHDCLNVLVATAMCERGICRASFPDGKDLVTRYRAAGLMADNYEPNPSLQFWEDQEVLRTMVSLKLAEFEGRQGVIDWARARLVELARARPTN